MTTLEISGLALQSPMRAAAAIVLWLAGPVSTGGGSTTSPADWEAIPPTPPRQFMLATELEILPHPDPNSSALIVRATVGDSLPHIEWLPSALVVETDRGQELEVGSPLLTVHLGTSWQASDSRSLRQRLTPFLSVRVDGPGPSISNPTARLGQRPSTFRKYANLPEGHVNAGARRRGARRARTRRSGTGSKAVGGAITRVFLTLHD
jgi:hypothetical protein